VERGAQVTTVPVYEWGLPEDTGPLRAAVESIARREIDVVLFTTAMQVNHLLQIAAQINEEENVRLALPRMLIASVGPTTSERLRENEIAVDFEPSHPRMGYLVSETAQQSAGILRGKRTAAS
jgi:uroporphyrinogen-III synthase